MDFSSGRAAGGKPLASVIVNNYNYARFVGDAINSALAQTYAPLEVLVVDDGSTDGSREIISGYREIVPIFKQNGGQASAFNAGFAKSKGDVVIFLDADDILLPEAVEQAVEVLSEPGVVKVHWPLWEIDADGRRTGRVQPIRELSEGDLREKTIRHGPLAGEASPTSGNAWSRPFLDQILPMPEQEFPINSDGYLVTLAWIYGTVRAVAEPLGLYRVHGRNHFVSLTPAVKLRRQYDMYLRRCEALAGHLAAMGVKPDAERWRTNGPYQWEARVRHAKSELAALIPQGSRFLLVDEEGWGDAYGDSSGVLPGLVAVPYLERDGKYDGRPEDPASAIANLERLRDEGARYIVFTWATRWWLDEFPQISEHLHAHYPNILSTDSVVVFELTDAHEA